MILILTVDYMSMMRLWVGKSYNTYKYYKGYTMSMMYLGKVYVARYSIKKVISSTGSELVDTNDSVIIILLSKFFIEAQGYAVKRNIFISRE